MRKQAAKSLTLRQILEKRACGHAFLCEKNEAGIRSQRSLCSLLQSRLRLLLSVFALQLKLRQLQGPFLEILRCVLKKCQFQSDFGSLLCEGWVNRPRPRNICLKNIIIALYAEKSPVRRENWAFSCLNGMKQKSNDIFKGSSIKEVLNARGICFII